MGETANRERLNSAALAADATETFGWAYLSFAMLLGVGLNAWVGWWWADAVAALAMVPLMIYDGWEAVETDRLTIDQGRAVLPPARF